MRKHYKFFLVFFFTTFVTAIHAESPEVKTNFCSVKNTAFQNGEELDYTIYYSLIGIYVNAGKASLSTNIERLNNKPVYHITGLGKSNSSYSWVAKVNNRYETYMDTATLQPLKHIRDVHEDNYKKFESITFNQASNTAITNEGVYKVPPCVHDMISAFYLARNLDYSQYRKNDKITFSLFIDNEVHNLYMRYVGIEEVKTKFGKFSAIKLKPLLIKGNVFPGGEKMTVWVTNDANHIPIRVETALTVGSLKIDMMGFKNLRYPLTSLIKAR